MTRPTTTRRRSPRKTEISPRTVLLAGIGAASLGRKQAIKSIDGLAELPEAIRQRADDAAREAGSRVAKFRKQAKAKLAPVKKQVEGFAQQAQAEFETRFAPVLVKLGAKAPAKRTARKATRTARPAAKRTRQRA
ncbi:MAG: hypothetical protein K0M70_10515 [Arenimonas sp.]|uniref:hypothetical protein n=1 Tax=Arenimonas sp. TaxID=1872635 RepID=UPI0025C23795|nr:hypothetical protein [Arenimonas sp.]MBW8368274.1 hypothetical protein [Arenimonas sp.]